ncbi:hypothetical protein, variant 1 [Aphanomyces invadans]|uniref:Uncharacterized protein n=1 Tax=Aphanomyces invadans TaxID=157072 RepID=A0A024TR44_9STRA|nr:hypothetical protein, variant 1 [Aphanomyces invadans]ETV96478.1 hypothetical protein, variant 1 [Aphanomyces invadans]|eukprot:XP_008874741.1 hypothetical protein, variant 1 [Aphanomyces invadans]
MPRNIVRLIAGLILGCVLAPLSHLTSTPNSRHVLNTVLGIGIGWFVFDINIVHSLVPTLVTSWVGCTASAVLFLHLIASHAYRELWGADIIWDGAQMVLTMKLAGTAISYGDGALPRKEKTPSIMRNQLIARPSLLALLGYVYFFPTFLVGPIFEFNEYLGWVHTPRIAPVGVVLRKLSILAVCIAGHTVSEAFFPVAAMDSPEYYPSSSWRFFLQLTAVMFYKFRFYMVWQFGEVGGVLAGYGYDDTMANWDGLRNNNILMVDCPVNLREAVNNWNIKVAKWLHTYVYQRVGHKHGKPTTVSTLIVFVASALWHGLMPGYYAFFVLAAAGVEVGRHVRRRWRHYFHYTEDRAAHPWACFSDFTNSAKGSPFAIVYDLAGVALSWFMIHYTAISFVWLNMTRCFKWWATIYCLPHVVLVAALGLFALTNKPTKQAKIPSKKDT